MNAHVDPTPTESAEELGVLSARVVAKTTGILALPRETVVAAKGLTVGRVLQVYAFPKEGVTIEHFLKDLCRYGRLAADGHEMPSGQSSEQNLQEMLTELREIAEKIVGRPEEGKILLRSMRPGLNAVYEDLLIRIIGHIDLLKTQFWP